MTRKQWMVRAGGGLALVVVVGGIWAGFNASVIRAKLTARQLAGATTDEERTRLADQLVGYGTPGFDQLIDFVKSGDDAPRTAATAALDKHLNSLPDEDARAVNISGSVLEAFPSANEAGKRAILTLVPVVLKRTGSAHADRCRVVVAEGLKLPDLESRLTAVRLAIHPEIGLRTEVVPFLSAKEPELRGASLFAVAANADGDQVLGDEELFRWLHDPDAGVRKVCYDALVGRERSEVDIALGRRLTHTDPNERLKLLLDLRYDNDVADPEPWLERLSRDPEPAVRAGAARVMAEVAALRKIPCPAWIARVTDGDVHPTVRFVAMYYRQLPVAPLNGVVPAGGLPQK